MVELTNSVKDKLARGELALGAGLRQARTVDIAKAMKTAGFDWLFIDMEHNAMGIDIATQIAVAAQDTGITPLIRVPGFEHHHAARALDCGAQGVVFPHVDDAETAARLASYCLYPPAGKRSMTGVLPQLDFAKHPLGPMAKALNKALITVMMIESPEGVANAHEIAAIPGVDVLLVGTNDLCFEMGIPGAFDSPKVAEAFETVIAACKASGKTPGIGGVYAPELARKYIDMGMRFILSGNDLAFMMNGATAQANALRSTGSRA
ncbi:MAG: aldolase/citrate lyase family protein [Pseudomonadota bacterium]